MEESSYRPLFFYLFLQQKKIRCNGPKNYFKEEGKFKGLRGSQGNVEIVKTADKILGE
jgi:hypothetical protein